MLLGQQKRPQDEVRSTIAQHFPSEIAAYDSWLERRAHDCLMTSVEPEWRGQIVRDLGSMEAHYPGPHKGMDVAWRATQVALRERIGGSALDRVDSQSTDIVASLSDPHRPLANRRGLVVGHVQSGKTANYTATIAKACDWGYSLVIVLAGLHTALRQQTQQRLDEDLVQALSRDRHDGDWGWFWLTQSEADFAAPKGSPDALLQSRNIRSIAVVKKNVRRLENLVEWLGQADESTRQRAGVLILDDESDQASVNTSPSDRSAINRLLVKLLETMPTSSYVGFTATPYANVLIDPEDADDLYPRHFIIGLPQPEGHQGSEVLFGRNELEGESPVDGYDLVREVLSNDVTATVPPSNREEREEFEPEMTDSLADALRWFLLATAARRARGQVSHSSCLVHTSRYVDQHFRMAELVRIWLDNADANDDAFAQQWRRETAVETPATRAQPITFRDLRDYLPQVLEQVHVAIDNGRAEKGERLRYGESPATVVAVGGDTLSRGLTLEGLVSSYFVRNSGTYDALMQMGRWFGFRPGYEDLSRVWTDHTTMKAFRHLSTVEQEIRVAIDQYNGPRTPMNLALRIRTHHTLAVTSPAKMRHAVKAQVSYAGARMQTTFFNTDDRAWLQQNLGAGSELLDQLPDSIRLEGTREGLDVWRGVDPRLVEHFLERYAFHREHAELNSSRLLAWLQRRRDHGDPVGWNVAVVARSQPYMRVGERTVDLGRVPIGRHSYCAINRARLSLSRDPADIGALMSRTDRVIDLPEIDPDRPAKDVDADRARAAPGTALLALYPISENSTPLHVSKGTRGDLDALAPVLGVGLVLPYPTNETVDDVMEAEYVQVALAGDEDLTDDYEEQMSRGHLDDEGDARTELPDAT